MTEDERKALLFDIKETIKQTIKEEVQEHYVGKEFCGRERGNIELKFKDFKLILIITCLTSATAVLSVGGYKLLNIFLRMKGIV